MADYVTQTQDNGNVLISEDVVAAIVEHAVKEVQGVAGFSTKTGSDIAGMIGKKNWGKGVHVVIHDDNSLTIVCNIVAFYGQSVSLIAKEVQNAVASALLSATGLKIKAINVNVCGIVRQ